MATQSVDIDKVTCLNSYVAIGQIVPVCQSGIGGRKNEFLWEIEVLV